MVVFIIPCQRENFFSPKPSYIMTNFRQNNYTCSPALTNTWLIVGVVTGTRCESGATGSSARLWSFTYNHSSVGRREREHSVHSEDITLNNFQHCDVDMPRQAFCSVLRRTFSSLRVRYPYVLMASYFWQVVKFSCWIYDPGPHFSPSMVWPGVRKVSEQEDNTAIQCLKWK